MTKRARAGRLLVAVALTVAGLGVFAAPAPAQVPGKNGKVVVFTRVVSGKGDVWAMRSDGSGKINLTKTPEGDERDAVLSPAGDFVAFVRDGSLYRVRSDGSQGPFVMGMIGDSVFATKPAWSPGGDRLLFRGASSDPGDGDLYVIHHNGGRITNITNTPTDDETEPTWSSTANRIAFVSDRSGSRDVFFANADGSAARNVTSTGSVDEATPRFAPDGKKFAYVAPGNGGKPDVYVRKVSGGGPANLTNNVAADTGPSFSADGKKLLFSSDRGGDGDLFVANASASSAATDLSKDSGDAQDDLAPDWSAIQELNCSLRPGFNVILGTAGNDKIKGTGGPDQILGMGGNDKIDGGGGDDHLCGGPGSDTLIGGKGKDLLVGGSGKDVLTGNGARDALEGGSGDDKLSGGAGDDSLAGGPGNDTLRGDGGRDLLRGGPGTDVEIQ